MKTLIELIDVVKDINLSSKDFLTTDNKSNSKIQQYYRKILSGDFQTDAEAADFFYKKTPSHSRYKKLKYNLRNVLINTIFFYDPEDKSNDYTSAVFYCSKNILVGRLLLGLSIKNVGIELFQKALKRALEIEHTEYIVAASKHLRVVMGTNIGDSKKFHYYNDIYKKHKKFLDAESLAEEYYCLIALPYIKSKEKREDTHPLAKKYYQELSPLLKNYTSPRLHMLGRNIEVISYLAINDYQTAVKICREARIMFEKKAYIHNAPIRMFAHQELISCIQLKNYVQGKEALEIGLKSTKKGIYSWYIHQELHLMLALHSKEYNEAYHILYSVIKSKNFSRIQFNKERWEIHKVYIDFLVYIKKITVIEQQKFRIGKFLNSVPTYSKDKRGLNIPILIAQLLFMIVKKDYDQSIDRFEAIKKYVSRYVSKESNLRSNCFINMLLQIPNASFHKAGVIRKAQKYYDTLLATPLDVSGQAEEIEIIPYEDLWEFILESLETKRYDRR